MNSHIKQFKTYLESKKKMATNSVSAYVGDVEEFEVFLSETGSNNLLGGSQADITDYLLMLKNGGKTAATVNRKMASIRAFYRYMKNTDVINDNPAADIKVPKISRKEIEYLTIAEVEDLLSQPDDTIKGIRDRAILETLYATGLRVSELIEANVEDINLRMGFVTCNGEHGKARIIPLGRPSKAALEEYIYDDRNKILKGENQSEKALFLNYYGKRLTRQAMWKILKEYAKKADIEKKITPQILRNSFAVHMVQNGADLKSLQELLGHEDPAATQIYLSVTKNRIKDVYDNTHPRA
jgi:integrase/recombinase XerD